MSEEEISTGAGAPLPYENTGEQPEAVEDDGLLGPPWTRRTFLKAAALGTAAAAMFEGATLFAPLAAYADDLSGLNCTANDVRIPTPGVVLNEPCDCSGTFDAQVQFRIINNTGTDRYCVTLHLCPVKLSDGSTFAPDNIIIGNIPANFDGLKTVTIKNYPCGQGKLCFGACGPGTDPVTGLPDCSFPKGTDCPSGQCCSTITWNVKASDPCPDTTRQISSKCRHQQICIQGRGVTTIDCGSGVGIDCKVTCGSKTTVTVCTTNPASLGPFKYELSDGTTTQTATDSATCHAFTVGPITANTTFTGTVTDKDGCSKSASLKITTDQLTVAISVAGENNCDGLLTFSAPDPQGFSGCTPAWTIDGSAAVDTNLTDPTKALYVKVNTAAKTLTYRNLDGKCHEIGVTLTCGATGSSCQGTASVKVKQCVTTTDPCT